MSHTIDTIEESHAPSPVVEEGTSEDFRVRSLEFRRWELRRKRFPRWAYAAIASVFVAVLGVSWWLRARHFETTDDAQIDGHINVVSSRVSGTVLYVNPRVE